jgi:predicted dehydrogenase
VGGGLVAQAVHLPYLHDLAGSFAVAGLAEPDPRRREWLARRWGIPLACAGHEELLARAELDALLVCSPNGTHAQVTLAALAAGLHVLVEKPLCLTAADAARIVEARDRARRVVQVGYMKRFDPAYEALVADLRAERGPVRHLCTLTYDPGLAAWFAPAGAPPAPPGAGGFADPFSDVFLGALVHDVNLVHGLLDALDIVPGPVTDAWTAADGSAAGGAVSLPGGARWTMAWLLLPGLGDFRERVQLFGAHGLRELEFPAPYLRQAPTTYRTGEGVPGGSVVRSFRSWHESYARQLEHFHACVTRGDTCRTPPEQAARDIALLTALHAAASGEAPPSSPPSPLAPAPPPSRSSRSPLAPAPPPSPGERSVA